MHAHMASVGGAWNTGTNFDLLCPRHGSQDPHWRSTKSKAARVMQRRSRIELSESELLHDYHVPIMVYSLRSTYVVPVQLGFSSRFIIARASEGSRSIVLLNSSIHNALRLKKLSRIIAERRSGVCEASTRSVLHDHLATPAAL